MGIRGIAAAIPRVRSVTGCRSPTSMRIDVTRSVCARPVLPLVPTDRSLSVPAVVFPPVDPLVLPPAAPLAVPPRAAARRRGRREGAGHLDLMADVLGDVATLECVGH